MSPKNKKHAVKELVDAPPNQTTDEYSLDDVKGIGAVYKEHLEDAGIFDMYSLLTAGVVAVSEITGMTLDKAGEVVKFAKDHLISSGRMEKQFQTGREIYERRKQIERLTSGSKEFDKFLTGGFESQATYEIYGEFGRGKSQMCFTAAVMAQLPKEEGGLDGQVIYIDTEGTLRPERIVQIAEARGYKDPERFLDGIIGSRVWNYAHQEHLITQVLEWEMNQQVLQGHKPVKLLVVDSLTSLYRAEFQGQKYLARRQQALGKMYHRLLRIAEIHNCVCLVTNQMVANIDMFGRDQAVGGNVIAHTSTYRISLKNQAKGIIARMEDSPMHAKYEVLLGLSEKGITDPEK